MQVGDKKKASVLGVIAVGAVGFVIFQLVPKAEARPSDKGASTPTQAAPAGATLAPASASTPSTPSTSSPAKSSGTVVLQRDPFEVGPKPNPRPSTPIKKTKPEDATRSAASPLEAIGRALSGPQLPSAQVLEGTVSPEPMRVLPNEPPVAKSGASEKGATKKANEAQGAEPKKMEEPAAPAPTLVRLLGIVQSSKPVALLMVGDRERTARLGDEIVPGIRIEAIGLGGITFRKKSGARLAPNTPASGQLTPGEEISL